MKVLMTVPRPLTGGVADFAFDPAVFDTAVGIALFTDSPDVAGAAILTPGGLQLRFTSPSGTFGTDTSYPILGVALPIKANAMPGQNTLVGLDPTGTWLQDLFGPVALEYKPGTVTVGGSVNITNVIPGTPAVVLGLGFTPDTRVKLDGNYVQSQWISPNQILVYADVLGHELYVRNLDGSQDTYDAYVRGIPQGASANPMLAATVPVFTRVKALSVVLPVVAGGTVFTGVAIQNPNPTTAVTVTLTYGPVSGVVSSSGTGSTNVASATIVLPPLGRITRDVLELVSGVAQQPAGTLRISSPSPIQVIGLLGNQAASTVVPFAPTIVAAGN